MTSRIIIHNHLARDNRFDDKLAALKKELKELRGSGGSRPSRQERIAELETDIKDMVARGHV